MGRAHCKTGAIARGCVSTQWGIDAMEGILVLIGLAVLAVPILLVIALVSISGLKRRVGELEADVRHLRATPRAAPAPAQTATATPIPAAEVATDLAAEADAPREPTLAELTRKASVQEPKAVFPQPESPPVSPASVTPRPCRRRCPRRRVLQRRRLRAHTSHRPRPRPMYSPSPRAR